MAHVDHEQPPFPQVELVGVDLGPDIPNDVRAVFSGGIPKYLIGNGYVSFPATRIITPDLIAFGSSGFSGVMCYDTRDGRICEAPFPGEVDLVNPGNSSMQKFIEC